MAVETRAYDNEHGDPVVVMVTTGTFDVSRLVNLLATGLRAQIRRHSGGRAALKVLRDHGGPDFTTGPEIVCLCGSTRFGAEFRAQTLALTLAGAIVLSIGCDLRSDADLAAAGDLGMEPAAAKRRMDELHLRKIDLCDRVLVLDVGGYVGVSTANEIAYARQIGRPVTYLSAEGGAR